MNASNKPYAGAFCELDGEKLVIWDAELVDDEESFCAVPGQVININQNFVEVACGQGKLRLLQIDAHGLIVAPKEFFQSVRQRLR